MAILFSWARASVCGLKIAYSVSDACLFWRECEYRASDILTLAGSMSLSADLQSVV